MHKPGDHFSGNEFDLFRLVTIGDKDKPVYTRLDMGSQLIDALFDGPSDRMLQCGVTPRRYIPLSLEPMPHEWIRFRLLRPDIDR